MKSANNSSQLKDFEVLNSLGKGSFGVVFKVRRKIDKKIYVMKQIDISSLTQKKRTEAINEVNILSKLENEYVVKYHASFIDKNCLHIIMEYCEGGDLYNHIRGYMGRQISENKIWKFTIQMLLGLDYIHKQKVLHRDIKTMNIFLSKDENVRIGDLGVAKILCDSTNFAHTVVGTPYYLSPEMCEEKPYNEKSDIWALGCVIYELCTSKHPFDANNQSALIMKIVRGRYAPISSYYSTDMSELIDICLNRDYKKRLNAGGLLKKNYIINKAKLLNISLNYEEKPSAIDIISNIISPSISNVKDKETSKEEKKMDQKIKSTNQPSNSVSSLSKDKSKQIINEKKNSIFNQNQNPPPQNQIPLIQKKNQIISNPSEKKNFQKISNENMKEILNIPKDLTPKNKEIDDRNVKRIRKGAPQQISRQAQNAANQIEQRIKKTNNTPQINIPSPVAKVEKIPLSKLEKIDNIKEFKTPDIINSKKSESKFKANQEKEKNSNFFQEKNLVNSKEDYEAVYNLPTNVFQKSKKPKSSKIDFNQIEILEPKNIFNQQLIVDNEFIEKEFESKSENYQYEDQKKYKIDFDVRDTNSDLDPKRKGSDIINKSEASSPLKSNKSSTKITIENENEFMVNENNKNEENNDYIENKESDSEDHEAYFEAEDEKNEEEEIDEGFLSNKSDDQENLQNIIELSNEGSDNNEENNDINDRIKEDSDEENKYENHMNKELKKKYDEALKREKELKTIISIKVKECENSLGKKNYEEIIHFFRAKLNSEKDLDEEDQDEMDSLFEEKISNYCKPEIIYTVYKILHLEIELEKCKERIDEMNNYKNGN